MTFNQNDFVSEFDGLGHRYVLPRRKLGSLRHLGWILVGLGTVATSFMILWMSMPISEGIRLIAQQKWFGVGLIGFGLLGLFGLVPSLVMLIGGLAVTANRISCVVTVREGRVYSSEKFFFLRWRRKCPVDRIRRLRVKGDERQAQKTASPLPAEIGYAIFAERQGAKDFVIAPAYPRDLLTRLAQELAPRLEAEFDESAYFQVASIDRSKRSVAEPAAVQVVDGPETRASAEPLEQPAESDAMVERREDGITIRLPPAGVWRGSKGLMVFAIIWNGFVSIFVVMLILTLLGVVQANQDSPPWVFFLILIPFIAVGVGMLVAAINMGTRHAIIATSYDSLFVSHQSMFGKRVRQWTVDRLRAIQVGPSGMEVNDRPVMELQILAPTGKDLGFLTERSQEELTWIAGELQQTLGLSADDSSVPSEPAERDQAGQVVMPMGSDISVRHVGGELQINVASQGLRRQAGAIVVGLLFSTIGLGVGVGVAVSQLQDGFQVGDLSTLAFVSIWAALFGGAGLVVLLFGLVAARRRFDLRATSARLEVDRYGPFGHRQFVWNADDVESIAVADSGMQVNNRHLYQIKIVPRQGSSLGVLTGRAESELTAVAAMLRDAVNVAKSDKPDGD